jgi:hypothetical protein
MVLDDDKGKRDKPGSPYFITLEKQKLIKNVRQHAFYILFAPTIIPMIHLFVLYDYK